MLIRNLDSTPLKPVQMDGVQGASMAIMVGRSDGAPNFALRQFRVEPGGHTPRHAHDYEHEVVILAGRGTITLGDTDHPLRAGDVLYVPANQTHQFRSAPDQNDGLRFICLVPMSRDCGDPTPGS